MLGIAAGLWWDHLLRQAGRADLVQANGNVLAWLLAGVSAPTVGAVLAAKRPGTRWAGRCSASGPRSG
jgi:hypothetical protein